MYATIYEEVAAFGCCKQMRESTMDILGEKSRKYSASLGKLVPTQQMDHKSVEKRMELYTQSQKRMSLIILETRTAFAVFL